MVDLADHIKAKSDQLNADDLVGGAKTYVVAGVSATGDADQPVAVALAGMDVPWKPCKTMRRMLVAMWGRRGEDYKGRSVRLYRDPDVTWGGIAVGGIRIEAMSHVNGGQTVMLSERRGKKKAFKVGVIKSGSDAEARGGAAGSPSGGPPAFGRDAEGRLRKLTDGDVTPDDLKRLYSLVHDMLRDNGIPLDDRLADYEHDKGFCGEMAMPPAGLKKLADIAAGLRDGTDA